MREYVYAYSALSPWDARLDSLVLPEASTVCMNLFLEQIAARYRDEFIVMVLDGAGWHRSRTLQVPDNMALLALPPYAPELNPVELVWGELREKAFTTTSSTAWMPWKTRSVRPCAIWKTTGSASRAWRSGRGS